MNGITSSGVAFRSLLDGIAHEDVFTGVPSLSGNANQDIYTCSNKKDAQTVFELSETQGFSPYVSPSSSNQSIACNWPGFWVPNNGMNSASSSKPPSIDNFNKT
jgi:hypothetical protein